MAETEEYFPRGGKKPTVKYFKQSSNFLGSAEQGEKKKKRPKKKSEADDGYLSDEAAREVDQSYKNCAIGLSYKTIKPGVLILGRVRQVQETRVNVMLPCKMMGTVMACHVSEPYNKLLEAYVNDQVESIPELPDMFRPGQYVAMKVLEVDGHKLMLSMMPQHVNGGKVLADLHNGCLLQAAVSSVEDHGYVMDIGIPDTRAFLPKSNANPELELVPGLLTWVSVKSTSNSVVTLSNQLAALQAGVLRRSPNAGILPASAVDFHVDKPLDNGIEGHIFSDTTAYVQRQHADTVKGKKPALGQRVRARVLYAMPTLNTPFLTLKNIFNTTHPDLQGEQKYQEGDIIDDAQVIKITGRSIHFSLGGCVGTLSLKRVAVHEDLTDEQLLASSYPIGSKHKVRVLCYNLMDYSYTVSDQPGVLNERYFSWGQLKPGQVVDATIRTVDTSVTLTVGRMTGYVPHSHLSDAGVFIDPKKASTSKLPKKKYKVGQQVKARVLSVDPSKLSLFLTLKPSLLAADIEVLSDYRDAEVGKAYTGVIKYIRDYVIVSFFNNVVACVPRQYVTKDADVVLSEAFHIGQIVNCTILAVDPEAKKMTGSLTTVPFWPAPKREKPEKRKRKPSDNEKSTEPAAKKKKENKNQDVDNTVIEDKKDRKKKKDKQSKLDTEDTKEVQLENKAKKKKNKVSEQNDTETENTQPNKKKRDRKLSDNISEESDVETEDVKLKEKAKKNKVSETENTKPNKKKRDRKHSENVSEESDAIETDIYDSDQILTPTEQGLVELSDCLTAKQFKKRVLSLIKAIKAKTARMDRIDKKIVALEEKGLCAQNKKYHTAMHMEKLVIEQRIEKLMEALNTAQGKLKEFDGGEKEYIKKKDLKKQRKESETNSEEDKKTVVKDSKDKKVKESKEKLVKESRKAKLKEIKVLENLEPALEVPSAKDFWAATPDDQTKNDQDEESSSSDDEEQDQPKKKRKKLTVAEKLAKVREEEERVREMERRAVQAESQPRSSDQFERALLANPDCSQLWIAYMAFHLQATEIEKARAVGRKALNTINFREEDERLNVWLALLNCEHRFGTKESQQKTLEEALQMNDTYKVHSKLLDILVETSKQQELSSLVDLMLRKYKRDPQNYIACGAACFKAGLVDKARHVMQKAVAVLEKKEHVSVLVQFALMERRSGAGERAEALFEQVLAVYPQRADVCAVYVDMLRQSGDRERLRQVMERMTSQKLPARKMKVLYKKWIEAEEKLGDTEQVDKIRQRAMEFIDKAQF